MYSIEEINTNPIFQPPAFLLHGIGEHPTATIIKTISMNREFIKVKRRRHTWFNRDNLFGTDKVECLQWKGEIVARPYQKPTCGNKIYNNSVWIKRTVKNGIEILGMKPSIKTVDGKFKYENDISIKDLKQWCKDNGLKKYSTKSKLELVKMLMAI